MFSQLRRGALALTVLATLLSLALPAISAQAPLLLRFPALSHDKIAF